MSPTPIDPLSSPPPPPRPSGGAPGVTGEELTEHSFRKLPMVIEAVRVNAADWNGATWDGFPFDAAPKWLLTAMEDGVLRPVTPNNTDYAEWEIKTLEGTMLATPGDWIIKGVKGELYPIKDDIFAATYEPAARSTLSPDPAIAEDHSPVARSPSEDRLKSSTGGGE